jgi:hypothetical protein
MPSLEKNSGEFYTGHFLPLKFYANFFITANSATVLLTLFLMAKS